MNWSSTSFWLYVSTYPVLQVMSRAARVGPVQDPSSGRHGIVGQALRAREAFHKVRLELTPGVEFRRAVSPTQRNALFVTGLAFGARGTGQPRCQPPGGAQRAPSHVAFDVGVAEEFFAHGGVLRRASNPGARCVCQGGARGQEGTPLGACIALGAGARSRPTTTRVPHAAGARGARLADGGQKLVAPRGVSARRTRGGLAGDGIGCAPVAEVIDGASVACIQPAGSRGVAVCVDVETATTDFIHGWTTIRRLCVHGRSRQQNTNS